jgi:hypothetical protein
MPFPLVDRNNSSKTLIVVDGVIKGVAEQKPYLCMSKNSLDKEEDEGMISFKMSRLYFLAEPSLDNFFLNVSLVVDIIKIIKGKEQT